MEKVQEAPFKPWVQDLQLACLLAAVAVIAGVLVFEIRDASWTMFFIATIGTFSLGAAIFFKRYMRRSHGKAIEEKALRRLEMILTGGWTLRRNIMLPSGDLDGFLAGPDGQAFALEIKSKVSLSVVKGSLWRRDKLVDVKGKPIDARIFGQAYNNAFQVNARPVLWFPDTKVATHSKDIEQVFVVCGPSAYLLKVLGVPKKSWWSR